MASTQVKLSPYNNAKITFNGLQEISDFTATGAEASLAVTTNSDTDKEYIIYVSNKSATQGILVRLNNDSGANYGYQAVDNNAGTITGIQNTSSTSMPQITNTTTDYFMFLQAPTSFQKMAIFQYARWSSGTTITQQGQVGFIYNSTANITSLNFISASGNFASGTRIIVYVRRA